MEIKPEIVKKAAYPVLAVAAAAVLGSCTDDVQPVPGEPPVDKAETEQNVLPPQPLGGLPVAPANPVNEAPQPADAE